MSDGFLGPDGLSKITSGFDMTVTFFADALGETVLTTDTASYNGMNGSYLNTTEGDSTAATPYFNNSVTYYVKALIKNSEYERATGILAFTVPVTGNADLNFTVGEGFTTSGNKWGAWTSTSVPEPTSGVLLLLGFAGLALRRKRV